MSTTILNAGPNTVIATPDDLKLGKNSITVSGGTAQTIVLQDRAVNEITVTPPQYTLEADRENVDIPDPMEGEIFPEYVYFDMESYDLDSMTVSDDYASYSRLISSQKQLSVLSVGAGSIDVVDEDTGNQYTGSITENDMDWLFSVTIDGHEYTCNLGGYPMVGEFLTAEFTGYDYIGLTKVAQEAELSTVVYPESTPGKLRQFIIRIDGQGSLPSLAFRQTDASNSPVSLEAGLTMPSIDSNVTVIRLTETSSSGIFIPEQLYPPTSSGGGSGGGDSVFGYIYDIGYDESMEDTHDLIGTITRANNIDGNMEVTAVIDENAMAVLGFNDNPVTFTLDTMMPNASIGDLYHLGDFGNGDVYEWTASGDNYMFSVKIRFEFSN